LLQESSKWWMGRPKDQKGSEMTGNAGKAHGKVAIMEKDGA
jgi:hypothetical protein